MNLLHVTTPTKGAKLDGIPSINTSTLNNNFCSSMRVKDSVCAKCYAANMEKRYSNLHLAIEKNDTV